MVDHRGLFAIGGGATVDASAETDFCAKAFMRDLPPGQTVFYRVRFRDIADANGVSEPLVGRFRTGPLERRDVSFVWSGDTVGQGWGIDEARGGMTIYAAMRREAPDFFIHSGDTIYADNPLKAEVPLPDGTVWRNLSDGGEGEGCRNPRRVSRPMALQSAGPEPARLQRRGPHARPVGRPRGGRQLVSEQDAGCRSALPREGRGNARGAGRAGVPRVRADRGNAEDSRRVYRKVAYGPLLDVFFLDMRSYRAANGPNQQAAEGPDTVFLGAAQLAWLKRELKASRATWKVIAADMPLGLVVYDDFRTRSGSEAIAQGNGAPLGRELEFAGLLAWMKQEAIRNTVWLTADVHYTAAHRYDPARAVFQTSTRSGNSCRGRSTPAPSGRTPSTTPSGRRWCSRRCRRRASSIWRLPSGTSSTAMCASRGRASG
jgi:alkaline phosphatase D